MNPVLKCRHRIRSFYKRLPKIKTCYGHRFFAYGLLRRLDQIDFILNEFYEICPPKKDNPLTQQQISKLILLLNALYLNLLGCLDNIAWVIAYETEHIKDKSPNEFTHTQKQNINIFKRKNSQDLGHNLKVKFFSLYPIFYQKFEGKISHLKNIRNISAHQIPFYIPNILKNEDYEKWELYEEKIRQNNMGMSSFPSEIQHNSTDSTATVFQKISLQLKYQDEKLKENSELKASRDNLGRTSSNFYAAFSKNPEEAYPIYPTIIDDCNLVIDLLEESLNFLPQ